MASAEKSDLLDLTLQLHQRTERAILVSNTGDVEDAVWLPLSQIEVIPKEGGMIEATVPEWLAIERKLV